MEKKNTNSRIGNRYLPWAEKSILRTRKDMKSWNLALNQWYQADDPMSWMLQQLYMEIMRDAIPASQKSNRDNQIFSSTFSLKNAQDEVDEEETLKLKKHPLYRKLTQMVIDSEWFSVSLVELGFVDTARGKQLDATLIPRWNVVPQRGRFYSDYMDPSKYTNYRDMPEFGTWILEFYSGHEGMANKIVAPTLMLRFAESCWSELCEIYGIPPRVMKTNTGDARALSRADKMMKDMGAAAYFIIDETEEFEFAKGVSTNGDVYKNLINHLRNKICTLMSGGLIGQDTENGNRAKDEVVFEMLWLLVKSDMARVEDAWNNTIIPALEKHGVIKKGLTFEFDEAEDIGQLWKFVQGLIPFFDFDPEWLNKKFGVDIIAAKEQSESSATLAALLAMKGDPSFFLKAPTKNGACCGTHHITQLALPKDAPKSDGVIERVGTSKGKLGFDPDLFWETSRTLVKGLNKGLDGKKIKLSIEYAYGVDDPHLLTSFEMNLFRFSAGKTLAEIQALNDAFRNAKSYDIFKINAQRIGDVWNEQWLRTEFDTATLVGEGAATYYSLMRDVETFPYWEYKTVGDDKVRHEHAALDGLILPANDPIWRKLFPPNGWNCRCYIVGRMRHEVEGIDFDAMRARAQEYFGTEDWARAVKDGFGVNRALEGEVFTANQQYLVSKNLSDTNRAINSLHAVDDWKLKPYEEAKADKAKKDLPRFEGEASAWLSDRDTLNDQPTIFDYNGRPLAIDQDVWSRHTTGKNGSRDYLLLAILEAMESPDEVWLRGKRITSKMDDLVYLKYYLDETIVVIGSQKNSNLIELKTWFKLEEKQKVIDGYRRGMLIKK